MFYLIGDKTWIRCKLGARCMKQEDILNYFYFLCVNVENRLRCSTRTKMDLGRGCLIRVRGRGFWYTRRIGTLSNNIMCLLMFGNAFQCLAKVCDRRPSAHPHGHGQTNRSFETCTDKQKCWWQLAGRTWADIGNVLNRHGRTIMLMEICRMDVDRPDCKIMWEGGGGVWTDMWNAWTAIYRRTKILD